jgi:Domain of unknown function (DUF4331)
VQHRAALDAEVQRAGHGRDLADLRPFQNLHLIPSPAAPGVDATKTLNIHTIALQIPISRLTASGNAPKGVLDSGAVLGVWSAASRRKVRMIDAAKDEKPQSGPWVQVSRLGNPLFNEVLVPSASRTRGTRCTQPATISSCPTSSIRRWRSCSRSCIPACSRISRT